MGKTSIKLGVPEFEMRRVDFSLNLPQITVKDIKVAVATTTERADALAQRATSESNALKTQFAEEAKATIGFEANGMFDCFQSELQNSKNQAQTMFESGIASLEAAIASMVVNKVPEENEVLAKARSQLAGLQQDAKKFTETIVRQFADLDKQRNTFVQSLLAL